MKPEPVEKNPPYSYELVQRELATIARIPGNEMCADCNAKGPRWASVNLGLLICIDCSGIHRGLGTHISVVKSITLDRWNPTWISVVHGVGNELGRAYWEYKVPENHPRPSSQDPKPLMEQWIRDKYEKKLYVPENFFPPQYYLLKGENPYLALPSYNTKLKKKKSLPKEDPSSKINKPFKTEKQFNLLEEISANSPPDFKPHTSRFETKSNGNTTTDLLQPFSDFDNNNKFKHHDTETTTGNGGKLEFFYLEGLNFNPPTHEDVCKAKVDSALTSIDHLFSKDNPLTNNETTFPVISPEEKNPFFRLITAPQPNEATVKDKTNNTFIPYNNSQTELSGKQICSSLSHSEKFLGPSSISDISFRTGFEDEGGFIDSYPIPTNYTDFNPDFTHFETVLSSSSAVKQTRQKPDVPAAQGTATTTDLFSLGNIFSTPPQQQAKTDISLLPTCELMNQQASNKTEFFSADNLL